MRSAWRPLVNYILYNNSFTLIVVFLLLSGGTVLAANEDVREAVSEVIVSTEDTITFVDNSFIIDVDLESFDFEVQVTAIEEDGDYYYVSYAYSTIGIEDGIWQEVEKEGSFQVAKAELGEADLGLYIAEELKEFVVGERRLLAETQQIEKSIGRSGKIVERKYAGLIGRFLDPDEVTFEGYDPVVKEPIVVAVVEEADEPAEENETTEELVDESSPNEETNSGGSSTSPTSTENGTSTDSTSVASSTATSTAATDTTAPVVTLNDSASMTLTVGDVYSEPGASATDETDGDLTGSIEVSGTVDSGTAGVYEITYSVADNAGNSASETRTITVIAPEPEPEPEPSEPTETTTES